MSNSAIPLSARLRLLLDDKALEPQEDEKIILRERQRGANMRVTLDTASVAVTAVRLSKASHLSILKDGPCKRVCDYLLIYAVDGESHAVFAELKKTLSNDRQAKEQLRRSLPFLEYLRAVCAVEFGNETANAIESVRYFRVGEKLSGKLDKQPVRVGPNRIFRREEYENITINAVLGPRVVLATLSRA